MEKYKKQYVIKFDSLTVVMTSSKITKSKTSVHYEEFDFVVLLNSTKEVWMKIDGVNSNKINEVLETIKMGSDELSKVYLESSI